MIRFSYGAKPHNSRISDLAAARRLPKACVEHDRQGARERDDAQYAQVYTQCDDQWSVAGVG